MRKNEQCYNLRCAGMTNSEIASIVGIRTSQVPTFAKAYMIKNSLPHWSEASAAAVADSGAVKPPVNPDVQALVDARVLLESLMETKDATLLILIGDIARVSAGILRR